MSELVVGHNRRRLKRIYCTISICVLGIVYGVVDVDIINCRIEVTNALWYLLKVVKIVIVINLHLVLIAM